MRDDRISIMKGLAIVLIVVVHSGCPELLDKTIYLFHMPLFFFVSGWTFKEKYFNDKKKYLVARVKSLYWPFVKYGFFFLLLHNLFCFFNVYPQDSFYSLGDFTNKFLSIITFRGNEQLLGGYWFLKALFLSSLVVLWALFFVGRIKFINDRYSKWLVLCAMLVATLMLSKLGLDSLYTMASSCLVLGFIAGKVSEKIPVNSFLLIPISAILIFVAKVEPMSIASIKTPVQTIIYFIVSMIGTYGIFIISSIIAKVKSKQWLVYLGVNTLGILTFHFLSFKLVSLFKIWQLNLPIESLSDFPVIATSNSYYWILYAFAGVLIPLLIDKSFKITGDVYSNLKEQVKRQI